jgi:hypothetical protein
VHEHAIVCCAVVVRLCSGAPRPHKRHSRLNYLVQEGSAGFLGQGTFGPVYKCLNVDTSVLRALGASSPRATRRHDPAVSSLLQRGVCVHEGV